MRNFTVYAEQTKKLETVFSVVDHSNQPTTFRAIFNLARIRARTATGKHPLAALYSYFEYVRKNIDTETTYTGSVFVCNLCEFATYKDGQLTEEFDLARADYVVLTVPHWSGIPYYRTDLLLWQVLARQSASVVHKLGAELRIAVGRSKLDIAKLIVDVDVHLSGDIFNPSVNNCYADLNQQLLALQQAANSRSNMENLLHEYLAAITPYSNNWMTHDDFRKYMATSAIRSAVECNGEGQYTKAFTAALNVLITGEVVINQSLINVLTTEVTTLDSVEVISRAVSCASTTVKEINRIVAELKEVSEHPLRYSYEML